MHSRENDFHHELSHEVESYFSGLSLSRKGDLSLFLKPYFFILLLLTTYTWLVFFSDSFWMGVVLCGLLVFAMGGIGFGFAHDACHGAFSEKRRVNRWAGWGYDLIGGSSFVWIWKHNVLHHRHPNNRSILIFKPIHSYDSRQGSKNFSSIGTSISISLFSTSSLGSAGSCGRTSRPTGEESWWEKI